MRETPVSISRRRRDDSAERKEFTFTKEMMRLSGVSEYLQEYRRNAWEVYQNLAFPTTSMEAWRRTDIHQLAINELLLSQMGGSHKISRVPRDLLRPLAPNSKEGQVILEPGVSRINMDQDLIKKGVVFTDLQTAEGQYPEILEKIMGKIVHSDEGKFAALASALSQYGVLLYVPRGVSIEQPLHSILWGPGTKLAFLSHILVYLEEGATVTYVHEASSPNEAGGQSLHAGLVEIVVGPGANLRLVELQSWGHHVWNFCHERVRLDHDANLEWIFGSIGSHLTKDFAEIELAGAGSTGKMSGFFFTDQGQHLDHDTQQTHLAPNTTSDLLFKGALKGKSRSVWQGMIYVAPEAVKTDGYQANRNLILSNKARADSIPGLEILADDVRCSHGATVGKVDPEMIFYLISRGIPRPEAEKMIVEGFFDPIIQRIPFDGVRNRFLKAIQKKMDA